MNRLFLFNLRALTFFAGIYVCFTPCLANDHSSRCAQFLALIQSGLAPKASRIEFIVRTTGMSEVQARYYLDWLSRPANWEGRYNFREGRYALVGWGQALASANTYGEPRFAWLYYDPVRQVYEWELPSYERFRPKKGRAEDVQVISTSVFNPITLQRETRGGSLGVAKQDQHSRSEVEKPFMPVPRTGVFNPILGKTEWMDGVISEAPYKRYPVQALPYVGVFNFRTGKTEWKLYEHGQGWFGAIHGDATYGFYDFENGIVRWME